METYNKASNFKPIRKTVVTIGTYDGVHLGHRKIIEQLNSIAKQKKLASALLTFFPHPRMVLQQSSDLKLINTIKEKEQLLAETNLDYLIIEPFTLDFSRLSAEEYVLQYLVNNLNAGVVIIGYDHRFGRNRKANIEDLKKYAEIYNFEVLEIPQQDIEDVAISSTKIRNAILDGKIDLANTYLTHPFFLTGKVVKGKQLGKTLGYPTANLSIKEDYKITPKNGVYVVKSQIEGKLYYGMMNIGENPTISNNNYKTIETYFFDFNQDIYGKTLKIELLKRIRDEKKFNSLEDLKTAMKEDGVFAKNFIKNEA